MEWTILHRPGCGLNNKDAKGACKNMCYINAIIQCLANTAPFVQWLLMDRGHEKIIHNNINNEYTLSSVLSYATAESLAQQINELCSSFIIGRQEDPSEFLIFLLDHFKKCLTATGPSIDIDSLVTPIQRIFGLNTQFVSKCKACLLESTVENWETNCSEEILDGDNLYKCTNCKNKVPASRKFQIIQASPVIFIYLRRFTYEKFSKMTHKMKQFISYPEILNITPYLNKTVRESNKENNIFSNFTYKLYAVVVHLGENANSGHIFAYIRSPDGCWYKANDEKVTRIKLDKVLADKDAYILCYAKAPIGTMVLTDTELTINPMQSSCLFTSSTPIRPSKLFNNIKTNYSTTSLPKHIFVSSNDNPKQDLADSNLHSTNYSSILNDSTSFLLLLKVILSLILQIQLDESCSSDCSVPVKIQSFEENITECNNLQTESQIVNLRNNNSIFKPSNQKLSRDINKQQINNFHEFISSGEPLISPLSRREHLSSTTPQCEQSFLLTSQQEQFSSSVYELEPLSSSFSKTISSKISSSIEQNVTVEDLQVYDDFIAELSSSYPFKLQPVDLAKLLMIRSICTFSVTSANHRQLLRCNLRCIDHPVCPFTCSVIVQNNGASYVVVTNRNIRHARGVKICRPIRKPLRSLLKKQFVQGASVYKIHQEKLQKRTLEEKKGQNYDGISKTHSILCKIKSEGVTESLLAPDVDHALFKLFEKFQAEINPDGKVAGVIQFISKYPSQIIAYSETSIRLFDVLLKHKNVTVSWDATGSIIKEKSSRRLLYYELGITLLGIVNEDSIVPITFMISDAHALVNIIHWLQLFKHSYSQIFIGKQFPQPQIVLSDRAQVFLIASLRIWNNEIMNDFLNRAYRIITGNATDSDLQKTNIHACLAHVIIDEEKEANAMDSPFKSTFNRIFHDALTTCGLSIKEFQGITARGDLSRHRRRMVQSFETMTIHKEEQRTTAISERRMGILKRTQLGKAKHDV
ncbi:unnamed protein product [Rotaria sp. Silwood2]|nr:unnamed protein product [Rotaria sp. Silwood2]CAF3068572.1 unnamed protein product [Rotaria sp. Silwood2]CAF3400707.1 unnamed protein product [Rotaria sp. Silwood2]